MAKKQGCTGYQANRKAPDFVCVLNDGHGKVHEHTDGRRWAYPKIPYGMKKPAKGV